MQKIRIIVLTSLGQGIPKFEGRVTVSKDQGIKRASFFTRKPLTKKS